MSQSKTDVHPVGLAGDELAVVELEVVVQERRRATTTACGRSSSSAAAVHRRRRARAWRRGPIACASRASWRSRKPSGRPRSARSHAAGSTRCRSARASTVASPMRRAGVGQVGHRRRQRRPDHLAAAVLDDDEVGADDVVVVAEHERPRRAVVLLPQPRQHAVLTLHVVRARGDRPRTAAGAARTGDRRTLSRYVRLAEPLGNCSTLIAASSSSVELRRAGTPRAGPSGSSSPARTGASSTGTSCPTARSRRRQRRPSTRVTSTAPCTR